MACSVRKTGSFSSVASRIWIETDPRVGRDVPHVCRQNHRACRAPGNDRPRCIAACPLAAEPNPPLFWDDSLSRVVLRPQEKCKACLACVPACRFQAIRVDVLEGVPLKCDLCGGDPECVQVCVTGAIALSREEPSPDLRQGTVRSR